MNTDLLYILYFLIISEGDIVITASSVYKITKYIIDVMYIIQTNIL